MMKRIAKKFLLRAFATLLFCLALLAGFLLNPALLYAHKTVYGNCTIYHDKPLPAHLEHLIDKSFSILKQSTFYDPGLNVELCLNDGSFYPKLVESIMGIDLMRALSNKSVAHGTIDPESDFLYWQGKKLRFSQWFSHTLTHNLQFRKHGFFDANPLGRHPEWKWEGYAEYISLGSQFELRTLIQKQLEPAEHPYAWVDAGDYLGTTAQHFKYLVLVKYCLDVKKMSYDELLASAEPEAARYAEMRRWFENGQ